MSKPWFVFLFVASAVAQQAPPAPVAHQLFPCQRLERYDPPEPKQGALTAVKRLERLLKLVLQEKDGKPMNGTVQLARGGARGEVMIVYGTPEKVEIAKGVFEQLAKEEPLRVRVRCSLLTMPKALAAANQLTVGGTRLADDASIVQLTREAVKHGGTLQNLAELAMSPLTPVEVDAGGKVGGEERREVRLRAEMVPLAEDRVTIALEVTRRLPKTAELRDPTRSVTSPLLELHAGASSLTLAIEGDVATVLVVRCLELAPAPLASAPASGR